MGKKKPRKIPVTVTSRIPISKTNVPSSSTASKIPTQQLISQYHTLSKQLHKLKERLQVLESTHNTHPPKIKTARNSVMSVDGSFASTDKTIDTKQKLMDEIEDIQGRMDRLGGLHIYQRASLKGGNEKVGRGAVGKWVGPFILEYHHSLFNPTYNDKLKTESAEKRKLKLLDIGALSFDTYSKFKKYVDVSSIDLNPQCAGV
ncbi:hypothetical protein HK096_000292, partial [Nowakowskiella sp. JEL0078]